MVQFKIWSGGYHQLWRAQRWVKQGPGAAVWCIVTWWWWGAKGPPPSAASRIRSLNAPRPVPVGQGWEAGMTW